MRLIAATGLMLLSPTAGIAADRYHVVTPSFGCVVPWTTWALNGRNPHHHDRRWLERIAARGGCRLVSPIVEWERVGRIGRLVLMRQVPPLVGATPLLFRPSDVRLGEIADPAPALAAAPAPAPPTAQPDAAPAAAPVASAAPAAAPSAPVGLATASPAAPAVSPLAPAGAAPGASSPAPNPTDAQAAKPAGSDAGAPPAPPDPGAQVPVPATSPPAVSPPDAQATTPAGRDATSVPPSSDPAAHEPAVAAPSSTGPAVATAPAAPIPEAAAPAAPTTPVPPPSQAPATAASDAGAEPPAASPVRPAGIPGTARGLSPWDRVLIGAAALLALLAAVVVLGLRFLRRRRHQRDTAGQPPAEPYGALADEAEMPPIDGNAYRQWCVDSLIEAGWQARMGFPAGRLTADIMARRDGRLLTVQCRPSMRPLEATVVQEALVVRRAQDAQIAAVVSNAGYTRAARNLAAASGVRLLHETELTEFVN